MSSSTPIDIGEDIVALVTREPSCIAQGRLLVRKSWIAVACHCTTPTPNPSPQGGGEHAEFAVSIKCTIHRNSEAGANLITSCQTNSIESAAGRIVQFWSAECKTIARQRIRRKLGSSKTWAKQPRDLQRSRKNGTPR